MDTTKIAYTAEDLITHKLQRADILVAKPKFDQFGADLLGLLDVGDGTKFCRIQCKGRTLVNSKSTSVKIPKDYATDGLILFVFVDIGVWDKTKLYCFFGWEIREWKIKQENFYLSISRNNLEELKPFLFTEQKIREIKKAIINVDGKGEFHRIIHGYIEQTSPSFRQSGTGKIG